MTDAKLIRELAGAYEKVGDMWGGHRGESLGPTDVALANHRIALDMRQTLLDENPQDSTCVTKWPSAIFESATSLIGALILGDRS